MLDWQKCFPLLEHNTLHLPATSKAFLLLDNFSDLPELASLIEAEKDEFFFLGEGSNIIFRNTFPGRIIKVALKASAIIESDEDYWYVKASAGQNWHEFVKNTIDAGMFGLENLALIPGTVGAAPVQNIGAYGLELAQRLKSVTIYDFLEKCIKEVSANACQFGYRHSIFQLPLYSHWLIIGITFRLKKHWQPVLSYQELAKIFLGQPPTAREIFDAVVNLRKKRLPDPELLGNVGSFFKNPIVSEEIFLKLLAMHPSLPCYSLAKDTFKLSAAWLIEQCGFKGKRFGAVGVYEKQALVLVNFGKANATDVLELADAIKRAVYEKFGLFLEIEPKII